jgi:hypothetical protein
LAPHIESEIQPLILTPPAAMAAMGAKDNTAISKARERFMGTSRGRGSLDQLL